MSDVLIVLSSEGWGELREIVKEYGGSLRGTPVWGDGHPGESLVQFLNRHLSDMMYDENVHIVTEISDVKMTTRCPYYSKNSIKHKECGMNEQMSAL